jgi:arsenate reductase-like glutaredoxin family protein
LKRIKLTTAEIGERISAVKVEYRQKEAFLADNHLRVVLHSFFMGGKKNPTQKAEIEAILSAVIPGSSEISNRTMNEINQLIDAQKRDVEQKLALIAANPLNLLLKEREAHEAKIADIDARLRSLCKEIGVDLGAEASGTELPKHDRTALSASDLSEKLVAELKNAPRGMSQIDLSKATGCSYAAVIKWVKENPDTVKTTGEKRGKKVFLV